MYAHKTGYMFNRLAQTIFYSCCIWAIAVAQTAKQGALSGTVTDKNTLRPIAAATIQLSPATLTILSDTDRCFRFNNLITGYI